MSRKYTKINQYEKEILQRKGESFTDLGRSTPGCSRPFHREVSAKQKRLLQNSPDEKMR